MCWTAATRGGQQMGLAVGPGALCSAGSGPLPWWYAARLSSISPGENIRVLVIKYPPSEWP